MRVRAFDSLSVRLNLWYGGALTVAVALSVFGARSLALSAVDYEQQMLVQREVEQHRLRIEGAGLSGLSSFVAERRRQSSFRWFVRVIDGTSGSTMAYEGPVAELTFDHEALATEREGDRTVISHEPSGEAPWRVVSTRVRDRYWLQLGVDDRPRRSLAARIELSSWFLLPIMLLLSIAGGLLVTRRALAPLRALGATCESIVSSGDATLRVEAQHVGGEVGHISRLFNEVLDRNQRLIEGMRQALDNVAHDLRTPLSRLRSGAELALARTDDKASLRESLADCVEESDRVMNMLHTLMDISEAETGVMRLNKQPIQLGEVAREAVDLYEHVAEQSNVVLRIDGDEDAEVCADRQKLLRAVSNLVDNAIKYNRADGTVTLAVERRGERCTLKVYDTGMGIDSPHLDRIWERLYRADPSRSRQGLGLGLSFVRAIVEAHGGSVHVTSASGRGSTFTIELPRYEAKSSVETR